MWQIELLVLELGCASGVWTPVVVSIEILDCTVLEEAMNVPIAAVRRLRTFFIIVVAGTVLAVQPAFAATLYWNGSGTWDLNATPNWGTASGGPYNVAKWSDKSSGGVDHAAFEGSGGIVALNNDVSALGLAVTSNATSDYTIQGTGTLTLGAGGIDLSAATANLSIANNIALAANQTWKVAANQTLNSYGVISGGYGINFGIGDLTYSSFLGTTPTTIFNNVSLASVTSSSGAIGGAYVGPAGSTQFPASTYFFNNNGSTATYQLQIVEADNSYTKCVEVTLAQSGANITGYAVFAKYVSGSNLGFDFSTGGNVNSIATSISAPGYGAASTSISFGPDSPGTTILSGASTYTGPTTVTNGTLKAGIASVPGVSGALGNISAVVMGAADTAALDITGYDTQIGSLTGGGGSGGNVILGSNTLTVGGDNTSPAAYLGSISGDGGNLTKIGTGTLTLGGVSSYTGLTTVNGGTLNLVGNRGFNSGIFTSGNHTLVVNEGGSVVLTGDWTTNGNTDSFVITDGALTTVNTYSDADGARQYVNNVTMTGGTITGGGIRLGNNAGTPTYAVNAGTAAAVISSPVILVNTNVSGPATFNVDHGSVAGDLIISGAIRDFSSLTGLPIDKQGFGTMTLTGANTYIGTTTIDGGTLQLGNGGSTGSLSPNSAIVVNDTLAFSRSDMVVQGTDFSSNISGPGNLVQLGPGTVVLNAANTYSGTTSVNGGSLLLAGGTINTAGAVVVGAGATFGGSGQAGSTDVAAKGTLQGGYNNAGTLELASLAFSGSGTVSLGSLANSYTSTAAIVVDNALSVNGATSVTVHVGNLDGAALGVPYEIIGYSGTIGGTGTGAFQLGVLPSRALGKLSFLPGQIDLTITGSDYLHWTGSVSTAWDTNTANWILNSTSAPTAYIDVPGPDTVVFDDGAGTNGMVNIAAAVHPASMTIDNSSTAYVLQGVAGVAGNTALTKNGPGSLTINISNTYAGGTIVHAGPVAANAANALGTGAVSVNGGTLTISGSNSYSGGTTLSGGAINANAVNALSTGPLAVMGGVLTINARNSIVGATLSGGVLILNDNNSLGSAALTIAGGSLDSTAGSVSLANNAQNWNGDFTFLGTQNMDLGGGAVTLGSSRTVTVGGGTLTVGGTISDGGNGFALTKAGSGTLVLNGVGNYSGPTTVNSGMLVLAGDRGFNSGFFASGNHSYTINGGGAIFLSGDWTANGNTDAFAINGGTLTTVNTSSDPDGARQYINNVTMTGGLISGGGIRLGNNNGTPTYTVNAGTAAAVISSPITLVNVNVTGPATFNVARGTGATDLLISGEIKDFNGLAGLPLLKEGPGILTLSGTNTYIGGTIVTAGTLDVTNPAALLDGSSLTVNAGGTFVFGGGVAAAVPGTAAVPEPSTIALLCIGAAGVLGWCWRRR
jgi:fibronectin-binding autotransporter adhesin